MALVAEYGFTEGTGTTAGDSVGSNDQMTGIPGWTATGGHLDGPGMVTSNQAGGQVSSITGLESYTLMAWVKFTSWHGPWQALFQGGNSTPYTVIDGTGRLNTFVNGSDGYGTTLSLNTWYHVALCVETGQAPKTYLNGVQDITSGTATASGTPFWFGGSSELPGSQVISDVRVFDEMLAVEAVNSWKNIPVAATDPNLSAAFTGAGTLFADAYDSSAPVYFTGAGSFGASIQGDYSAAGWGASAVLTGSTVESRLVTGNQAANFGVPPGTSWVVLIAGPGIGCDNATLRHTFANGVTLWTASMNPGVYQTLSASGGHASYKWSVMALGFANECVLSDFEEVSGAVAPSVDAESKGTLVNGYFGKTATVASNEAWLTEIADANGTDTLSAVADVIREAGATPTRTFAPAGTPGAQSSFSFMVTTAEEFTPPQRFITGTAGTRFVDQHGEPMMLRGDSGWMAPGLDDMVWLRHYMYARARQGFNTVQIDVFGQHDFDVFNTSDWSSPREEWWAAVDRVCEMAEEYGHTIIFCPYPRGDDWARGLASTTATARAFGQFLGTRYGNRPNIVWQFGGDYDVDMWASGNPKYQAVLDGIRDVGADRPLSIMSRIYGDGGQVGSISDDCTYWVSETDMQYVYDYGPAYVAVRRGWATGKPTFLGESNYEGENNTWGPNTNDLSLRRQVAWTLTSGGVGDIYANAATWSMGFYYSGDAGGWWPRALYTPVVAQINRIRDAIEEIAYWALRPDVGGTFLTGGAGTHPTTGTMEGNKPDPLESSLATAARAADGSVAVIYLPTSRAITVDLAKLGENATLRKVDPASGASSSVTLASSIAAPGTNSVGDSDWLYIFEADPLPSEATGPTVIIGGVETPTTLSIMLGGVETSAAMTAMVGGVETALI